MSRTGLTGGALLFLAVLAGAAGRPAVLAAQQDSVVADTTQESPGPTGLVGGVVRTFQRAVAWASERVEASRVVPKVLSAQAWLTRHGIKPRFAGHGRKSGTGPWVGVGWFESRDSAFALHAWGGITHKGYSAAGARIVQATLGEPPLQAEISGQIARRPQDEFFGLGNASREVDITDYELVSRSLRVTLAREMGAGIAVRFLVDWSWHETGPGTNDDLPDIEQMFASEAAPGYGLVAKVVAIGGELEWLEGVPFSQHRRATWIEAEYRRNLSQSDWMAHFGQARLWFGLERPVFRGAGSVTAALEYQGVRGGDSSIPFYFLPALGGAGFPAFQWDRFRAREIFLSRLEGRSRLWRQSSDAVWVDAILFTAHGFVADDLIEELSFSAFHHIFGVALGVVTPTASVGRVGVFYGGQGVRAMLAFGSTF
jgi:hypothetical protein